MFRRSPQEPPMSLTTRRAATAIRAFLGWAHQQEESLLKGPPKRLHAVLWAPMASLVALVVLIAGTEASAAALDLHLGPMHRTVIGVVLLGLVASAFVWFVARMTSPPPTGSSAGIDQPKE
jgi:hypothetical protein